MRTAFKNIPSSINVDFAAIQILLSVMAISLAGMTSGALTNLGLSDLRKPVFSAVEKELKVCPVSASKTLCGETEVQTRACDAADGDIPRTLNFAPFSKASKNPICSVPNHRREGA
jgi:hypothetical protein